MPRNAEATFSCVIDSVIGSVVDITWSGPDSILPPPVNTEENGVITSNLTINVTDGSYEGQMYNCSAQYQYCLLSVTSSLSATFFIILLPVIVQPPFSIDVFEVGDSLSVTCVAARTTNYGSLSITWTGPILGIEGVDTIVTENNLTNSLTVTLGNYTFGGLYTCIASNEAGTDTAIVTIFLRPMVLPEMILASTGDDVTLMCVSQSMPYYSTIWEKQNNLGLFEIISGESGRNLTIRISFGNEGVYRCAITTEMSNDLVSTTTASITGK